MGVAMIYPGNRECYIDQFNYIINSWSLERFPEISLSILNDVFKVNSISYKIHDNWKLNDNLSNFVDSVVYDDGPACKDIHSTDTVMMTVVTFDPAYIPNGILLVN